MNSDRTEKIIGKQSVVSELGYWPEFCDAKLIDLQFSCSDLGDSLSILLHYIDTDKGIELNVKIILSRINRMEFHSLSIDNVVDRIVLIDSDKDSVEFQIEAAIGLYGNCSCQFAEVELVSAKSSPRKLD